MKLPTVNNFLFNRYIIAILATLVAFLVRLGLDPWLAGLLPFVTFFISISVSSFIAGLRSASFSLILGALGSWYFMANDGLPLSAAIASYVAYFCSGAVILWCGHKMHEAIQARRREVEIHKKRLESIIKISQYYDCSTRELIDKTIEEAVDLTDSEIGYIAFMSEDESVLTMQGWSRSAMKQCNIIDKPIVYQLKDTGLWGEAVRQRKPVVSNNYEKSPWKKGYPTGHVPVKSHLNLPIFDEGKIVAVVGVGNKKTPYGTLDIKHLTALLDRMWQLYHRKQQKDNLEKVVNERTSILQETNTELTRSNDELSKFAYVASHDLKAPLRAVINLVSWIDEDVKAGKDVSKYVDKLNGRVRRMENLIEGLLEYSRVGRVYTEIEEVNSNEIITRLAEDYPENASKVIVEGVLPKVKFNKVRLGQIFSNLIGNAFKHHHDVANALVKISCKEVGDDYLFCIDDNGPGIEGRYHEKIFEIFQTLKPRDELESTGIGLSIVKKIIEDQDGCIYLESIVGEGSKFYFSIRK